MSGEVLIFSGRPGTGKTTIANELLKHYPGFSVVKGLTTREIRDTDLPGQYKHVSEEKFKKELTEGKILWSDNVHGYYHGLLKTSVDAVRHSSNNAITILTPDVTSQFIDYMQGNARAFYILSPPEDVLRERLKARGDADAAIAKKLAETKHWDTEVQALHTPPIFIHNEGSIEDMMKQITNIL